MGAAGVETLILRMAKFFQENNYSVDVLLMREVDKNTTRNLRQYAKVYIGWHFFSINRAFKRFGKEYYDCIYTFSFFPLIYSLYIRRAYFSAAKICFGVYHPLEYCGLTDSKNQLARLSADLIKKFPKDNIFFMNQGIKDRHSEKLQHDFLPSPIVPIPVDVQRFADIEYRYPCVSPYKIVSIGRITDFKTYNFTMLDVVAELIHRGFNVEYYIYGEGAQFQQLKKLVYSRNMQKVVHLPGAIPYEDFAKVLKDAFLFVGLGTALVEAAACKLPCLQAIEMDKQAECYGFFHNLTGFNVGEKDLTQRRYKMVDLIMELIELNPDKYQKICELSYKRAQEFGMDGIMNTFISCCKSSKYVDYILSKKTVFFALFNMIFWFVCRKLRIKTPFDTRYTD